MRAVLFFLLLIWSTFPSDGWTQEPDTNSRIADIEGLLESIETDIDEVNENQDAVISNLRRELDGLRRRIDRFDEDYEQLKVALATADALRTQLTTLTTDVATAKDDSTKAFEAANSIRWIVAVAAVLITGMTATLGLLFSQRFVDLKADARVAQEVLARVEKRIDEAADTEQALARIEERLEAFAEIQRDEKGS